MSRGSEIDEAADALPNSLAKISTYKSYYVTPGESRHRHLSDHASSIQDLNSGVEPFEISPQRLLGSVENAVQVRSSFDYSGLKRPWSENDEEMLIGEPASRRLFNPRSLQRTASWELPFGIEKFRENLNIDCWGIQDFQDLFCTLMVALPLGPHRHRLTKYQQTFTTGEALNHLGNLRFTQSNRRPSPTDPNVMVTTKIATTFSMVAPMAKSLCNKFLAARLVESIEGKTEFQANDSIWQLTPKGIKLLENFAHRNGVQERHIFDVLDSHRNKMNLLVLERDAETDALNHDRPTVEVIWRRFIGLEGPNIANGGSGSDSESIIDSNGLVGVKLFKDRRVGNRLHNYVFSGSALVDWLMNCCTLVDIREAEEIGALFVEYQFIRMVQDERSPNSSSRFPSSKGCLYKVTELGQRVARWIPDRRDGKTERREGSPSSIRDSNTNRMTIIVNTPSLRLMFREFLKETHCEENLVFYLEVRDFLNRWSFTLKKQRAETGPSLDTIRETLAAAYDLYNAFLAPGSPCELNIDHTLRNALVSRMTRFELPDSQLLDTVKEVISLYEQASNSVFKLMASDSVPKFLRDPNYHQALYEYNLHTGQPLPGAPGAAQAGINQRSTSSG